MEQLLIYTVFGLAFSYIGYKIGRIYGAKDVEDIVMESVDITVSKLIRDGYIRTVGGTRIHTKIESKNEKKSVDICYRCVKVY